VAGFAGEGKVLLFGAQGFWRWGFLPHGSSDATAAEAYSSFVLRMVRWIAEPTQRDRFHVEPLRGVFQNGEMPQFTARVWDSSYAPVSGAQVALEVLSGEPTAGEAVLRRIELRPGGGDGIYAGSTDPLPPGTYRLRAEARDGQGAPLGRSESPFWVDENGPEYMRQRPDRGTMEQIARAGGGQVVEPQSLVDWIERLPDVIRRAGRVREIELWNHLALFLSFVAVLSVEWFLRRRRGLA
jgi:hypothetical protein